MFPSLVCTCLRSDQRRARPLWRYLNSEVYQHGTIKSDVATILVDWLDPELVPEMELTETNYELLSEEDFEADNQ